MEENKVEENNEDVFYVRNVKKFVKNFEHPKPILRDKTEKNGLEKKRETMSKMSFKKLNDLKKNLQESMQYRYESGSISSVEGKPISQVKEALKKSIENLSARSNLTSPGPKNKDRNTFYRRFSLTAEQIKPFPLPKPRTSLKRKKFKSIPNLSDELIIKEKPEEEKKCFKQPLASADAFSHSKNSNHFSFTFSPSSSPVKPNDINLFLKSHTNNSININDIHNYEFSSHINEQRLSSFNEILRNTKANPKDHQNIQNRDRKSINSVSTPSNTTNTSIELNEKQDKSNINLNENNNSNNKSNDISPSLFSTSSYCSESSDVIETGSYYIYQISINDVDVYHKDNGIDQKIKVGSHVNYNAKIGVGKNGEGESDIGVSNYSDNDIINSNHNVEKSAYKVEKIPIQGIKHIENDDNNRIESSVENNGVDTQANDGDDLTIVKENENSKLLVLSSSSTQSLKEDIDKVKVNKSDIPLQFSHSTEEPVEKVTDTKNELAPRQDLEKNMSLVHNKPCLKVSPLPNTQQQKTELHQSTPQQHVTIEETTGDMTKPSHNHQNFAAIDVSDIIIQAFYTKTTKFFKSCMKHLQKHNHTQNTKDISLLFTSPMAGFERVEDVFDIKFPLPSEEDDDDDGGDNDDDEVKDESSSEREKLLRRGVDLQMLLKDLVLEKATCDADDGLFKLKSMLKEAGDEMEKCMAKVQAAIEKFDSVTNLILLLNKMISAKVYVGLSLDKTKAIEALENKMADAKELKVALDNKHICLLSNLKNISNQETCVFYVFILKNIMSRKFTKEFISHKSLQVQCILDLLNAF